MKRPLAVSVFLRFVLGFAGLGLLSLGFLSWGASAPAFGAAVYHAAAGGPAFLRATAVTPGAKSAAAPPDFPPAKRERRPGNHLAATEDQDDKTAFRHSATVRAVGRLLHLDPEPAARLFEYFNFALLAGAGLYFFVMYFPRFLREHRAAIQKQLVEARAASEQANARLRTVEERLSGLDDEIRSIRERAERESAAEEARIKALIETEQQRIVASAEQEIAASASAARRDLKRFAGELAIDRARRMISLSGKEDQALIQQSAAEIVRQFARPSGPEPGRETRNGGPH